MFNVFHDVETGKITKVNLTSEELAELEIKEAAAKDAAKKEVEAFAKIQSAKAAAEAKLAALGLTADDLKALGL